MNLLDRLIDRLVVMLGVRLQRVQTRVEAATLPRFSGPAPGLVIRTPREIGNPESMSFGRDVKIGPNSVLKATTRFPGSWLSHPRGEHVAQTFTPSIRFGDRVTATGALQVVAFEKIDIGDDVMFASNIYISDGQHGRSTGERPYKFQGIEGVSPVSIGRGSWIGQNTVILPGTSIGEMALIGANSVVSGTIPPNSIAVGAPARVVRVWDADTATWTKPTGNVGSNGNGNIGQKPAEAERTPPL